MRHGSLAATLLGSPLAWGLIAAALPGTAAAQPLHVEVEGLEASAELADALAEDLGRPVSGEPGQPTLRVVVAPGGRATLTYTTDDGLTRTRTVTITADREAAVVELALVGSNLVRDQTDGLIDAPAPAPEPTAGNANAPSAHALLERATAWPPMLGPSNLAQRSPLHFGMGGGVGFTTRTPPSFASNVRAFSTFGFSLTGTIDRHVSIGLTRFGVGLGIDSVDGTTVAIAGTPHVELFEFIDPRVQVFTQLGLTTQWRSQTSRRESILQAAVLVGMGLRLWASEHFTVGLEGGAQIVLTDSYLTAAATLTPGMVPVTGALTAEWHLQP